MASIKPLDEELVLSAAQDTGCIITAEEHNIAGGMGSAVAEYLVAKCPVKMKLLGIPNETPGVTPREVLLERYHLTGSGIASAVSMALAG